MNGSFSHVLTIMVTLLLFFPGNLSAAERFIDNGDGTVTDHELGLMWARADNQGDIDWNQAEKWARYTIPFTIVTRYENWRLPTLTELRSIAVVDKDYRGYETDCGQWVKINTLVRLTCGWVWTSETDAQAPTVRVYNFNNNSHYSIRKAHRRGYRALAVRNIK